MKNISEKDLALFINLLSIKLAQLHEEYQNTEKAQENLGDAELEDLYQLQELIEQYKFTLGNLRVEYESGLKEGLMLPSFAELSRPFPLIE